VAETRPAITEVFRRIVGFLEREKVEFVVVGGLAASLQGRPRYTEDIDLMVNLRSSRVPELAELAKKEGFEVAVEPAGPHWASSGFLRLLSGPKSKETAVDLMAMNSEYLRQVSARAQETRFCEQKVRVASPEDVIVLKLAAYRQKDFPDLETVFLRNGERLDREYLRKWTAWFAGKNPLFKDMPERIEALLGGQTLLPPPAAAARA
jgi:predicted nucleotidyltransferase